MVDVTSYIDKGIAVVFALILLLRIQPALADMSAAMVKLVDRIDALITAIQPILGVTIPPFKGAKGGEVNLTGIEVARREQPKD